MLFKRKIYDDLLKWKNEDGGRTVALIEGARRVGKTTVVTEFAKKEYRSCLIINFSEVSEDVLEIFRKRSNLDSFFMQLQLRFDVVLYEGESLIVFDEIQFFPLARQMLKQLVADGRYHYIETGSLISVYKNVKNILIPSEEHPIPMYPMDFEEWLWANGNESTVHNLRQFFESRESVGMHVHKALLERFMTYLIVGGMPQVVDTYLRTNNMAKVDEKKNEVLDLYRSDMVKLPERQYEYARALFDGIPTLLSSRKKTFSPGKIMKGSRSRSFSGSITWLDDAKMILPCYSCNDPNVTVNLTCDKSLSKLYFVDTGLLISLAFGKGNPHINDVYMDLIRGKLSINQGMFFENMVAQQLVAKGYKLMFHQFESDGNEYEVDFIIPGRRGIIPLEVKSSSSTRHRSLDLFKDKYRSRIDRTYVIHGKDLRVDGDVVYIPIYMTMFL